MSSTPENFCLRGAAEACGRHPQVAGEQLPLSRTCCRSRMRICKIGGDRKFCARMAHLGLLPGSEMEVLCPGKGNRCMIKVNGGTITLDDTMAEQILVSPV